MNSALNWLLSGGRARHAVAARLHALIWARRLMGGRSAVPEMRLLDEIALEGRVAIDVGAHAGNWTFTLARQVGPEGKVIAYEALPHYGRALSLTLRLLRVRNVQIRPVAVGESERTMTLRWRSESDELLTGRTHIEPGAHPSKGVLEIPMVSLDHDLAVRGIAPSDVGFIKIDVEGAELEVLRGAANLLSDGRPFVYLEAEPQWISRMGHSVQDIFTEMKLRGYVPCLTTGTERTPTNLDAYLAQYTARREYNNVLFVPGSEPGE
nr:FkbM family methyltransferase [Rhodococcus erythropolis]